MTTLGMESDRLLRIVVETPLGRFGLAATPMGLRSLVPLDSGAGGAPRAAQETAASHGREGLLEPGEAAAQHLIAAGAALRAYAAGVPLPDAGALDLAGSGFQLRVWRRLLAIRFGAQVTYGTLARDLGLPGEARAVGAAVAANPIAILVPCHRVVGAGGTLRGYAWGIDLKRRLLAHELRIG